MSECVYKAAAEKCGESASLLICKSGIVMVGLRILLVNVLVCDIKVTADDDSLSGLKSFEILSEIIFPLHSTEYNTFAILYDTAEKPERQLTFTEDDYGTCAPQFCYVRNTSLVVSSILSGDSQFKFTEGDYLKLVVTGYLAGKETGKAEWFLADYRVPQNGGAAPVSVTTVWKQMPLTKLGNIDAVDFSLDTNKEGFPKYVCLDNLVASISVKY